jgi:hypothetical protein
MARSLAQSGVRRAASLVAAVAALLASGASIRLTGADAVDPRAVAALERLLERPAIAHQYRAERRLEASGSGQRAWLDVRTEFTLSKGLEYDVTAEGGSRYIRGRVLRSLLDEERSLIARGASASVAITRDNYLFSPERIDEDGLAVVGLKPLRKDRALVLGRMLLTLDGDLVRVEGRLTKSPSFWVTRATMIRSYRRINGVLMPVSLDTTGQLRLLGSSALRMTYRYTCLDDRPVEESTR